MGYKVYNFPTMNNSTITSEKGSMQVIEYGKDLSVMPENAANEYFQSLMNVRRKQLKIDLSKSPCNGALLQAGEMQWMLGNVQCDTGVTGAGDLIKKTFSASATGETAIKPRYYGTGIVTTEPTFAHLILLDAGEWGPSGVVLSDGIYYASEGQLELKVISRNTVSSALAGGQGLFNLMVRGQGIFCIESPIPYEELVAIDLQDDILKIDGSLALVWSNSLKFTVERAGKSLIGSAASGEGLVNVYKGTGRVLLAPIKY